MNAYKSPIGVDHFLQWTNLVSYARPSLHGIAPASQTDPKSDNWVDDLLQMAKYTPGDSVYFCGPNGCKWYTVSQIAQLGQLRSIQENGEDK